MATKFHDIIDELQRKNANLRHNPKHGEQIVFEDALIEHLSTGEGLFESTETPARPESGNVKLFAKNGAIFSLRSDGTETQLAAGADLTDYYTKDESHSEFLTPTEGDKYYADSGHYLSLPMTHINYEDGLANEEIARVTVETEGTLTINRLQVALKGGTTDSNFSVDVFDETNGTQIVETSDLLKPEQEGINATVSGRAHVLIRVTNATGAPQDASISGDIHIVPGDEPEATV